MKPVTVTVALAALALSLLSACGEKPQTIGGARQDAAPYSGVGSSFSDPQWKQRDRVGWESHLRARAQQGQNDYNRMN
jgi:hypothetical protein